MKVEFDFAAFFGSLKPSSIISALVGSDQVKSILRSALKWVGGAIVTWTVAKGANQDLVTGIVTSFLGFLFTAGGLVASYYTHKADEKPVANDVLKK